MKDYEKPQMSIFALSGTDALCACNYDAVGSNMSPDIKNALSRWGWLAPDGKHAIEGVFTDDMNCNMKLGGYCKNNPTDQAVFNS